MTLPSGISIGARPAQRLTPLRRRATTRLRGLGDLRPWERDERSASRPRLRALSFVRAATDFEGLSSLIAGLPRAVADRRVGIALYSLLAALALALGMLIARGSPL